MRNFTNINEYCNEIDQSWIDKITGKKIRFKYPNIIEIKKDCYCAKHSLTYDDICHVLPSGKLHWTRCLKCREELNRLEKFEEVKKHLENAGHIYNYQTNKWLWKSEQENMQQPTQIKHKIGSYRNK